MINFKEFNVGDVDYNEQIENFQKEHPSAEFVQITGGHTSYEKIWFKYESPEIIHPISPTREDPKQPVLDLINGYRAELKNPYVSSIILTDVLWMLDEIQQVVEDMEV